MEFLYIVDEHADLNHNNIIHVCIREKGGRRDQSTRGLDGGIAGVFTSLHVYHYVGSCESSYPPAGDWNTNIWSAGEPLTIIRAGVHSTYQHASLLLHIKKLMEVLTGTEGLREVEGL